MCLNSSALQTSPSTLVNPKIPPKSKHMYLISLPRIQVDTPDFRLAYLNVEESK